jgi:competence protein ComEC
MQAEKFYHRPVIPLTVALMAGIAFGSAVPGFESWALGLVGGCGAAVACCLARRTSARISPLLLFTALGYLSLQPWLHPRFPENHVSGFLDTGPWRIVGVVDARPLEFESRTRLVLRVERLERERETHDVSGLLRVTVAGEAAGVDQGDRIGIYSRIRAIRNFNNPGGFDFKRSMAYRGIWGSAFAEGGSVSLLEKEAGAGWLGWIDRLRSAISRLIDQAGLGPKGSVLKALVVGDPSAIPPDIRQTFTRTGTSHILAISGLHIALVASVAFAVFRWLLCWFPPVSRHAWVRKGAALLTLIPVTLYALLAGFSPSTQRALLMVSVFLLAFLAERETDLMNTLALAAFCILAVQPASLFSISFQLSFAAVGSIVYGFGRLKTLRSAAPSEGEGQGVKIKRGLSAFFGVSLIATWGTLPLGMYYFNTVSFIGLAANCVAIPLMGYIVVMLGLAGTLLAPLSVPAAVACYQVSGWVLSISISLMDFMAAMPFAAARTISPSLIELALFYLLTWALFHLATGRASAAAHPLSGPASPPRGSGQGAAGRLREAAFQAMRCENPGRRAAVMALILFLIGACADAGYWIHQRFGRRDLRVTLLDVGQGSAVLLEFPGGATALVDGGGVADLTAFDVGAHVVAPFLWRRKIATVDTLILTHPNSDHLNGLLFIADNFNVKSVWTNGESRPLPGYQKLMRTALERGMAVPRWAELPRNSTVKGAALEVLYPPGDFRERLQVDRWRQDENNNSLVTRVALGEVSVLIPGDIMRPAEKELVALAGDRLKSTVLIAPHHGSRTSSSEEFLAAVAPQAVFISCADRPGSGLPHPQTLERYSARKASIYRTDRNGAVQLTTDGRRYRIEPTVENAPRR